MSTIIIIVLATLLLGLGGGYVIHWQQSARKERTKAALEARQVIKRIQTAQTWTQTLTDTAQEAKTHADTASPDTLTDDYLNTLDRLHSRGSTSHQ